MGCLNYISYPVTSIHGAINVPGDKSLSHRAIIFGAIAKGITTVYGFLEGDDCLATIAAFRSMGVNIEGPVNQKLVINGVGKYGLKKPQKIIDCGNSGTSIRLLSGLLAAQSFDSELTGDESLLKRPMSRISNPLQLMGADIITLEGKPPIKIKGSQFLTGIEYSMPVVSAQVKTCLLLAGMYAQGQTRIIASGISRNHTELMLNAFSYPFKHYNNTLLIDSHGECIAVDLNIPGDISSAAFFIVAATLIPGSELIIHNIGVNPTRTGILAILKQMGANITVFNFRKYGEEPVADLKVKHAKLQGITIPEELVPLGIDEFPIIFIAAACAEGETQLHGAKELRVKESDRIRTMIEGLKNLGIDAQELEDGVLIQGGVLQGGEVDSFGDHRVAMSFAIAGAVAQNPIFIKNCASVTTSFPHFLATANEVQMHIESVSND